MLKSTIDLNDDDVYYPSIDSFKKVPIEELSSKGIRSILLFKEAMRSMPSCEFHVDENENIMIGFATNYTEDLTMHSLETILLTYCIQVGVSIKEIPNVICYAFTHNMWVELSKDETYYNFVG